MLIHNLSCTISRFIISPCTHVVNLLSPFLHLTIHDLYRNYTKTSSIDSCIAQYTMHFLHVLCTLVTTHGIVFRCISQHSCNFHFLWHTQLLTKVWCSEWKSYIKMLSLNYDFNTKIKYTLYLNCKTRRFLTELLRKNKMAGKLRAFWLAIKWRQGKIDPIKKSDL